MKLPCGDPVLPDRAAIACVSATDLPGIEAGTYDLVITDPPFGGLLHYSELADFFYVWLRLVLKDRYPDLFSADYTPKALEAVREPGPGSRDPDAFYQRHPDCSAGARRTGSLSPAASLPSPSITAKTTRGSPCSKASSRPVSTSRRRIPIRSDETKGEGEFGSKKIEYDIDSRLPEAP